MKRLRRIEIGFIATMVGVAVAAAAIGGARPLSFWGISFLLGGVLIGLSLIDFRTYRLPNVGTYGLMAMGLIQAAVFPFTPFFSALIGASLGYGLFWAVGALYFKLRGEDGLGLGDAKLLAAGGAFTGGSGVSLIILIGSASALLAIIIQGGAKGHQRIAFGPWLGLGIWVTWLAGLQIGLLRI